jgi:hypothetical protein
MSRQEENRLAAELVFFQPPVCGAASHQLLPSVEKGICAGRRQRGLISGWLVTAIGH